MLCRIIFCIAVSLAILSVILMSVFSPMPKKHSSKGTSKPWVAISLYIQQPHIPTSKNVQPSSDAGAFIFRRTLTEGPENTSRIIGKAQGFIIPIQPFARSAFNVVYLTFDTPEYSGSLSVQAKHIGHEGEQLTVVGGTGSFAFARGVAVFAQTDHVDTTYHVKLHLRFPDKYSRTIPG
ncbi:dirigent protein 11-like [Euphorbia lathyris]|uniref:dirigent protein 11-like n=1 Tax=Euphorbia lathyris TaxID=212925 RepID=UPI0033139351